MQTHQNEILNIRDLEIGYFFSKKKKRSIFSDINLTAKKGELIVLIGENGIGKSTLLRSIAKLQKSLQGSILISGQCIKTIPRNEFAKKVSFVSTEIINVNNFKVHDLVSLGRFPYTNWLGKLNAEDLQLVHQALSMVGMKEYANKNVNEISDGERQRVMIARTLAQDTEIIVLDEPTAFLDLPNKYEIVHILNHMSKTKNKTIIISTHELNIAIHEADKIWLMISDHIVEGAPEDLILNRSFGKIFENSKLVFDINKGDFRVEKENGFRIGLYGHGTEYFWTKKALERLNFIVSPDESLNLKIIINNEKDRIQWICQKKQEKIIFNSIYDLSLHLKNL